MSASLSPHYQVLDLSRCDVGCAGAPGLSPQVLVSKSTVSSPCLPNPISRSDHNGHSSSRESPSRSGRCPRPQKSALIRNLLIRSTLHPKLGSRRLLHPIELELLLSRYRTILTSKALREVLWTYSLFEQAFLVIPPPATFPCNSFVH
jgi:hypothetical protein